MARISKPTDYSVTVEGVGTFTFARRNNMRDELEIQREYADILRGVAPTAWLEIVGNWISVFKVLTVTAPSDWDLDEMDPLDKTTYAKMKRVYDALSEKENSFRSGNVPQREGNGASSV